jgi:hypothetical protein
MWIPSVRSSLNIHLRTGFAIRGIFFNLNVAHDRDLFVAPGDYKNNPTDVSGVALAKTDSKAVPRMKSHEWHALKGLKVKTQNLIVTRIVDHNPEFTAFRWMARLLRNRSCQNLS